MSKKSFAAFASKKIQEDIREEVPDVVKAAAEALEQYEEMFGTEAVYKMVEKTCMEEMQNPDRDPGYVEYIFKFLNEMKREAAQEQSN